ncbi:MAG: helix-turn-helix domain-containing protein [Acidilobaceae archaeon]|nr:helix-turn-helix domain-containing protein [Acidilobaceae archaeon]MCX8165979.1 helix-turn-helix domain-containing protein [Acidilobaceae archaeon]MDW7974622.1 helix-turn-helix domain-containing protein [Sulfolobales archaeon]
MQQGGPRDTLYRTIGSVYDNVSGFVVLEYPRSSSRRSIDVMARLKDGRISLLKVLDDLSRLSRAEAEELKSVASALRASSLVIAEEAGGRELLDEVVYEKHGVMVLTPSSLEKVLENEKIYVYQSGDTLKVKINSEELRRRRNEMDMSLGQVAQALRVSRKTVYEYERGTMDPSIERGEKLVEMFGEEILKAVDVFAEEKGERRPEQLDTSGEIVIANALLSMGFKVAHARRTAFDIIGKREETGVSLVIEHGKESLSSFLAKYYNSMKVSRVTKSEVFAVVENRESALKLKREGVEALTKEEVIELIKEMRG